MLRNAGAQRRRSYNLKMEPHKQRGRHLKLEATSRFRDDHKGPGQPAVCGRCALPPLRAVHHTHTHKRQTITSPTGPQEPWSSTGMSSLPSGLPSSSLGLAEMPTSETEHMARCRGISAPATRISLPTSQPQEPASSDLMGVKCMHNPWPQAPSDHSRPALPPSTSARCLLPLFSHISPRKSSALCACGECPDGWRAPHAAVPGNPLHYHGAP